MYAIYLRKSRADLEAESRGEGETLARHKKILLDVAKKQQLQIGQIYQEIVSGETISERPEMQKLLVDVENGMWKGVLVTEVERLTRGNTKDQGIVAEAFTYSDTKIITPLKTYNPNDEFDSEYLEFGLFMSRREYKTILRRAQKGREQSAKEGNFIGTVPYGYNRIKQDGRPGLEINPEQSKVVKLIFDLYVSGNGIYSISRILNEMGVKSKSGSWSYTTVNSMLKNKSYIGKVTWSQRKTFKKLVDGKVVKARKFVEDHIEVDGKHESIIDPAIFDRAQEVAKGRVNHPVRKDYALRNPLAGVLFCMDCGRSMKRGLNADGSDCVRCPNIQCKNSGAKMDLVESEIIEQIEKASATFRAKAKEINEKDNIEFFESALENITQSLADLSKQKNKIHDLLEREVYTTEVFLERNRKINEETEKLKKNEAELKRKIANIEQVKKSTKEIVPKIKTLIETYSASTYQEKNDLLKAVFNKIEYKRVKRGQVTLVLHPKT
jgi:DNA invertase Pin-like site-specific DNA recombinase